MVSSLTISSKGKTYRWKVQLEKMKDSLRNTKDHNSLKGGALCLRQCSKGNFDTKKNDDTMHRQKSEISINYHNNVKIRDNDINGDKFSQDRYLCWEAPIYDIQLQVDDDLNLP